MTTKRENILAAIKTALTGTTGGRHEIYRSRVEPMSRMNRLPSSSSLFQILLFRTPSLPTLDWTLRVRIVVIERGTVPDQAADDTIQSLHSKMMADLTWGWLRD